MHRKYQIVIALLTTVIIVLLIVGTPGIERKTKTEDIAANSIAVLPIKACNSQADLVRQADSLTESIINILALSGGLKVVSRSSTYTAEGDAHEIGRILGARFVVEGLICSKGDSMRVAVQLVGTEKERHFWSETYDRERADISDIPNLVSMAVKRTVRDTM